MEKPPIISPPSRKTERRSRVPLLMVLACVGVLGAFFLHTVISRWPPQETKLINNFYAHRAAYERLRQMLEEDNQVRNVRTDAVATQDPLKPSVDRRNEYMSLLRQVGGDLAIRRGPDHSPTVFLWGWGWAGCSRNIGISWEQQPPTNQVATLFGYRDPQAPTTGRLYYRHIDENWYLWADF
jgi:hypothetical protein